MKAAVKWVVVLRLATILEWAAARVDDEDFNPCPIIRPMLDCHSTHLEKEDFQTVLNLEGFVIPKRLVLHHS